MPVEEDMSEIDFLGGLESDWKTLIEKDREARAALARAKRRKKK